MAWNGLGTFILNPAYSPEVNGTIIDATRYNGLLNDIAVGLTAALAKNGENVPTANLPMGGYKHTGAAAATTAGEYIEFAQLASGSGANLTGYLNPATGAVVRTVTNKLQETVSIKDFGAVGDGVADDTAAIQAAVNAAATLGYSLSFVSNAVYKITSSIVISTSNLKIYGNGATLDGSSIAAAGAYDTIYGLKIEGTIGSSIAVGADIAEGAFAITSTTTSTLAAGDLILLASTEGWPIGTTRSYRGALHRIRSIDSASALTLMDGAFMPMTSAGGLSIKKITPVSDVIIDKLYVKMGGANKVHCGIRLKNAVRCKLVDCKTTDTEDCGVRTVNVFGGGVYGGDFSNCTSPADGTSGVTTVTGYGCNPGTATRDFEVVGASFRNCRHAVAGGGDYGAIGIRIVRCHVDGNRAPSYDSSYSLDCHEDCLYWVFDSNVVSTASTTTGSGGMLIRGQKTTVTNNTIINPFQYGIYVRNYDNPGVGTGTIISGNTISKARVDGIVIEGLTGSPQSHLTISNNHLYAVGGDGITLFGATHVKIIGNQINGQTGSTKSGIRLVGTAATAGNQCKYITIANNIIDAPTYYGIRADYADSVSIDGNVFTAVPYDGINLTNCTKVGITGGRMITTYALGSGVALTACTKVSVSGLSAENTGAASGPSSGVYISGASTDIAVAGGVFTAFNRGVYSTSPANYISVVGCNGRGCITTSIDISASANTAVAGNL